MFLVQPPRAQSALPVHAMILLEHICHKIMCNPPPETGTKEQTFFVVSQVPMEQSALVVHSNQIVRNTILYQYCQNLRFPICTKLQTPVVGLQEPVAQSALLTQAEKILLVASSDKVTSRTYCLQVVASYRHSEYRHQSNNLKSLYTLDNLSNKTNSEQRCAYPVRLKRARSPARRCYRCL